MRSPPLRGTLCNYQANSGLLSYPRPNGLRFKVSKTTHRHSVPRQSMSTAPGTDFKRQKCQKGLESNEQALSSKDNLTHDMNITRNLSLRQVLNVPNVITMSRILATPYLAQLILQEDHVYAIGLLALAGFSDWLDGFLARTFNQESIVGSFLDPFADKLLIGTLSVSMMWTGLLPFPLAALILSRDFLLIGGTFYHRLRTKTISSGFFDTSDSIAFEVKPSMLSKLNTASQLLVFGSALANTSWQIPSDFILNVLFGAAGMTTVLSGSEYLYGYMTKTAAFKPIGKPLSKVVQRTELVLKRQEAAIKRTKEALEDRVKRQLRSK
ncbi:hypothetical protein CCR75_005647 [Bremia lactucae]|uniref:Cardiolipin synthase n=1 Tax=Bremia lactucae TaxID=4779 RepID=A0A976IFG7_BRELC|nr:hypothetical protein CCR75_005647 [Bremia lactucae]